MESQSLINIVIGTVLSVLGWFARQLWENYRLTAIAGLAGFFLAAGAITWYAAKRKAKAKPRLFWSSLMELEKDRQHLDRS
jgi:uncharacterized membrane protein YqjE